MYDFLFSVEHRRRYLEKCLNVVVCFFFSGNWNCFVNNILPNILRGTKVIHVWSNMKVIKWWQKFHFGLNILWSTPNGSCCILSHTWLTGMTCDSLSGPWLIDSVNVSTNWLKKRKLVHDSSLFEWFIKETSSQESLVRQFNCTTHDVCDFVVIYVSSH